MDSVSFSDMVKGVNRTIPKVWSDWANEDPLMGMSYGEDSDSEFMGDGDDDCITFTKEEKEAMRKPWRNALIVKLLGKSLGYNGLQAKIHQMWKLEGEYRVTDLDHDYFIIRFEKKSRIMNMSCKEVHGLLVATTSLLVEYFNLIALKKMGGKVGRVIKIDQVLVEYEGLSLICFECGIFGHRKDECLKKGPPVEEVVVESPSTVVPETPQEEGVDIRKVIAGANVSGVKSGNPTKLQVKQQYIPKSVLKDMAAQSSQDKIVGVNEEISKKVGKNVLNLGHFFAAGNKGGGSFSTGVRSNGPEVTSKSKKTASPGLGLYVNKAQQKGRCFVISETNKDDGNNTITQALDLISSQSVEAPIMIFGRGHSSSLKHDVASGACQPDGGGKEEVEQIPIASSSSSNQSKDSQVDSMQVEIGLNQQNSTLTCKEMVRSYKPDVLCLLETKAASPSIQKLAKLLHFSKCFRVMGDFNDFAALTERWGGKEEVRSLFRRIEKFREIWDAYPTRKLAVGVCMGEPNWVCCGHHAMPDPGQRQGDGQDIFMTYDMTDLPLMVPKVDSGQDFACNLGSAPHRPFRFEAAWLTHPDFSDLFATAWAKGGDSVSDSIAEVTRELEAQLREEFQQVLYQEELLWLQKSRLDWIYNAERNTKFFHLTTVMRRNRNLIVGLNVADVWTTDQAVLSSHVKDFFFTLFSRKMQEFLPAVYDLFAPKLNEEERLSLLAAISLDEVHKATFSMKGLKAPGVDGIQPIFYQKHWSSVQVSLVSFVQNAFEQRQVELNILRAHMVLIPKGQNPGSVRDLRPITLLNTWYKILSKVIVNRMRPILQRIIGPYQNSFLAGRSTSDNILIAQEVIHTLSNLKGRKGAMVTKIDLQKAYDNVDWRFLEEVLVFYGFPAPLVQLIMFCVPNTELSIIWNGDALPHFKPQQGLRQDNLLLFASASDSQFENVMDTLEEFGKASGLRSNLQKSRMWVSPNVHNSKAVVLSRICGIPLMQELGTYLGVPLIHKRVTKDTYSYVVDKVIRRLANWKGKVLSQAGRRTLIQSTLSSIPIYTMQTAMLSASTCETLDRINRNFLWGGDVDKSGYHLKYLKGIGFVENKPHGRQSSTWRGIRKTVDCIRNGSKWCIGDGVTTNFWLDKWVGDRALCQEIPHPEHSLDRNTKVAAFIRDEGSWNLDDLSLIVALEKLDEIRAIPLPISPGVGDRCFWAWDKSGVFTNKSAYGSLANHFGPDALSGSCRWIWRLHTTERIRFFLWSLTSFKDWLHDNALKVAPLVPNGQLPISWSCLFVSILWSLWKARNNHIFKDVCPSAEAVLRYGAGGLLRDDAGNWVGGFMLNIGRTSSLCAELWGVRQGLIMARNMGLKSLVVELDAIVVVQFLKTKVSMVHPCYTYLCDCYELITGNWIAEIHHILREGNRCADMLATLAHEGPPGVTWVLEPPEQLQPLLAGDKSGEDVLRL
ncbi:reverse transcriptase [Corchorus capsularis]|uniref:Reverse transcriptase n=1 Tax=Corchorus capsularis TaxID=210143 RepID=A0A1R3FVD7_COCAP|nr:reverse transcriptase [Corchorus capsularis]